VAVEAVAVLVVPVPVMIILLAVVMPMPVRVPVPVARPSRSLAQRQAEDLEADVEVDGAHVGRRVAVHLLRELEVGVRQSQPAHAGEDGHGADIQLVRLGVAVLGDDPRGYAGARERKRPPLHDQHEHIVRRRALIRHRVDGGGAVAAHAGGGSAGVALHEALSARLPGTTLAPMPPERKRTVARGA